MKRKTPRLSFYKWLPTTIIAVTVMCAQDMRTYHSIRQGDCITGIQLIIDVWNMNESITVQDTAIRVCYQQDYTYVKYIDGKIRRLPATIFRVRVVDGFEYEKK